jgi:predicted nucleotidyltransferase
MNTNPFSLPIKNYFKTKPVLKAYFFGSILSNNFSEKSDIDILVELDYINGGADFFTYLKMQEELNILTNRKVDLVSSNGLSKFLKKSIDSQKELIYERER